MLQKLKEYKDLIGIILFFLGGFFWIQKNYPDKTYLDEQLKATAGKIVTLNCYLSANINTTDAQLQIKIHTDNIDRLRTRQAALKRMATSNLSDSEKDELDDIARSIENERDGLQKEKNRSENLLSSIKSGACTNV